MARTPLAAFFNRPTTILWGKPVLRFQGVCHGRNNRKHHNRYFSAGPDHDQFLMDDVLDRPNVVTLHAERDPLCQEHHSCKKFEKQLSHLPLPIKESGAGLTFILSESKKAKKW